MSDEPTVTLNELCKELKVNPREARMMLRLAAKKKADYPTLAKDHVPRQPWEWAKASKGLAEARKVLTAAPPA